jgi:hypothetical protein
MLILRATFGTQTLQPPIDTVAVNLHSKGKEIDARLTSDWTVACHDFPKRKFRTLELNNYANFGGFPDGDFATLYISGANSAETGIAACYLRSKPATELAKPVAKSADTHICQLLVLATKSAVLG